jgi:GGDEF domain-containing protein
MTTRLATIGYAKARMLLIVVGLAILGILAALLYVRRVDSVEVAAVLLFIPVFLGFILFRAPGGLIAGLLASGAYVLLRLPAIDAVGFGEFAGLVVSRSFAYIVFGLLGGWSNQTLELSLDKLDLYDQIDDATGLFNARFFVQHTDLEIARARRYQTLFSVAALQIPAGPIDGLGRRKAQGAIRELGRQVGDSVRTVDRVAHVRDGDVHRFVCVLPETGTEGATIFTDRFADSVHEFLQGRGIDVERSALATQALTVPGDDDELQTLRERFASLDELEHEHPVHL